MKQFGVTSPLVVDSRGNELLEFNVGSEGDLDDLDPAIPMPLALVVARHENRTLLVFNRWREQWELPGGMIEPGETSREAAVREFVEETGQPEPNVAYCGVATFRLMPDRRLEHAAVYRADLPQQHIGHGIRDDEPLPRSRPGALREVVVQPGADLLGLRVGGARKVTHRSATPSTAP